MTNADAVWGFGSISYTFDANGNQITSGGNTYSYTATGNVTGLNIYSSGAFCCATITATYNAADQLATELTRGGAMDTNSYDFKRQRTIKACCGSPSSYYTCRSCSNPVASLH